eukprot:CAMPEP_0117650222 /NCGR_PEP_ID=MMETSP0804-20121206/1424_1 /TAXON_ID=1074897 /ORGANISM="Tetraselmis astigmatica, Strain CCMP880" /LENGTH=186 /DNA_ID=CAMNT_0005456079 /DNA_START=472 /DNA_END=1032 /DNA_ORIENTATION=-
MYPSLNNPGGAPPPPLNTTAMAAAATNPYTPSTPTSGGSDARVRVEIASAYRSEPPVPLTSIESIPDSSNFQFDFEYERKVVKNADLKSEDPLEEMIGEGLGASEPHDPFLTAVNEYKQMGFPHDAACMAVGMYGIDGSQQDDALDFCKNYPRLKEMGFPPQTIAGALYMNKNDVQAATEQLMSSM